MTDTLIFRVYNYVGLIFHSFAALFCLVLVTFGWILYKKKNFTYASFSISAIGLLGGCIHNLGICFLLTNRFISAGGSHLLIEKILICAFTTGAAMMCFSIVAFTSQLTNIRKKNLVILRILHLATCILVVPISIITSIFIKEVVKTIYIFMSPLELFTAALALSYLVIAASDKSNPKILRQQIGGVTLIILIIYSSYKFIKLIHLFIPYSASSFFLLKYSAMMIVTIAVSLGIARLLKIRLLNLKKQVSKKILLEKVCSERLQLFRKLKYSSSSKEIKSALQKFFWKVFKISSKKLFFCVHFDKNCSHLVKKKKHLFAEIFLEKHPTNTKELRPLKILVKDELEFSLLYEKKVKYQKSLELLSETNSEIFLPIFCKDGKLVAHVTIEANSRPNKLYSQNECDEMVLIATYLSQIVSMVKLKQSELMMTKIRNLTGELHDKKKLLDQYYEGISSFIKDDLMNKLGLVLCKSDKKLTFINKEAEKLVIDGTTKEEARTATKLLKKLAAETKKSKKPQFLITNIFKDEQFAMRSVPINDKKNAAILIRRPGIIDVLGHGVNNSGCSSENDLSIFMKITNTGKMVSRLIPAQGKMMINFKKAILKAGLSCKPVLLQMESDDLPAAVETIHRISSRKNLKKFELENSEERELINLEILKLLYTRDPEDKENSLPINLGNSSTLYIKNVHMLNASTQEILAEFLNFGSLHAKNKSSILVDDARIVCGISTPIDELMRQKKISKTLYYQLKKNIIKMPDIKQLPEDEFSKLTDEVAKQAVKNRSFESLLSLNNNEKLWLSTERPASLRKLRKEVYNLILKKAEKDDLEELLVAPIYFYDESELLSYVIKLGKDTLKDQDLMTFLWDKLKSQSKIATHLGVNRTSVHRRCKQYRLLASED